MSTNSMITKLAYVGIGIILDRVITANSDKKVVLIKRSTQDEITTIHNRLINIAGVRGFATVADLKCCDPTLMANVTDKDFKYGWSYDDLMLFDIKEMDVNQYVLVPIKTRRIGGLASALSK